MPSPEELKAAFDRVPEWMWELNGAGDPARIWIDHKDSGSKTRTKHAIDAGFSTGTWVMRLTLPADLDEVTDAMHPALIVMGLSDASRRLNAKIDEAVERCRSLGMTWDQIAGALGVTRQAAWRKFSTS